MFDGRRERETHAHRVWYESHDDLLVRRPSRGRTSLVSYRFSTEALWTIDARYERGGPLGHARRYNDRARPRSLTEAANCSAVTALARLRLHGTRCTLRRRRTRRSKIVWVVFEIERARCVALSDSAAHDPEAESARKHQLLRSYFNRPSVRCGPSTKLGRHLRSRFRCSMCSAVRMG